MAGIGMQDPLSTEIQSPFLAGIVEGLNRISTGIDMKSVPIEKGEMTPVKGLDTEDPRRIYQAADGNRLWVATPEPKIYVNDALIDTLTSDYTVDLIGGSITFTGEYRPEPSDAITFSCDHIYAAPQISGGYEIVITFSSAFEGKEYTVSGGETEHYSGIVPASLQELVRVNSPNTEYTVTAQSISGESFSTKVSTGQYYGRYEAVLNTFSATISVTAVADADVTVSLGEEFSVTQKAGSNGVATIRVGKAGEYSVKAYYQNVYSETAKVNVESTEQDYPVNVKFITLTVYVEAGSSISVTDNKTTLQGTSESGSALFYLPNTGTWTVSAAKDGLDTSDSVVVSAYSSYSVTLNYIQSVLENNSWDMIKLAADKNLGENFWEVGDTKSITLNGTVGILSLDNLKIDTYIIGFNHNASREGNNLIHFKIGKISGKQVALCDSQYNNSGSSTAFRMNTSNTNSGGWNASYMRNTILGNSSTPDSPASNSLLAAMPSDLRAVMQSAKKYTNNTGYSSSSDTITATEDYLSLLSEFEIRGEATYSNSHESEFQTQYDYYKNGNATIHYNHSSSSSAVVAWLRSPNYNYSYYFCSVFADGSANNVRASYSYGAAPAFYV